jgi:hypothetical protein
MRLSRQHRFGSAMVLGVVVSVVISALVAAMCWVAAEQTQRTASLSKVDQAFFAAEAGMQRVQWYCKNSQLSAITSPLTGTINGYNYSVSWTVSGSTARVASVGNSGSVSYSLSETIDGIYRVPALQSMGPFDNKNIDVVGDVVAGGDYMNSGTGSLTGDLTYYGTASDTGAITGAVTKGTGSPRTINFPALMTTLAAAAGRTYTGDQTNVTFDFTSIAGTNKVIYVNGNVTNPTFIGSGTLCVTGTIATGAFGLPGSPVELVAQGSITTDNNVTIYGTIYTGGDWNRGKFHHTEGMVYTGGIVKTNSGQSTIVQGAVPWFDPRANASAGGGITTRISGFAGPLP